jgi:hypothetical protein
MRVPGKKCSESVTRHWKGKRARGLGKLLEFLMVYSKPSAAERKHYELVTGRKAPKPLPEKEREAWAKKSFAQITGRGLGELEMITITSLLEEWSAKKKNKQKKRAWAKALSVIDENRKEAKRTEPDRFIKSFGSSSYSQSRRKS